jgi:hypothetical protein
MPKAFIHGTVLLSQTVVCWDKLRQVLVDITGFDYAFFLLGAVKLSGLSCIYIGLRFLHIRLYCYFCTDCSEHIKMIPLMQLNTSIIIPDLVKN